MRLLFVAHGFPPDDCRGGELYTFHLARELMRSHEVHVLYARHDFGSKEYGIRRGIYNDIPYTSFNQTQLMTHSLRETYLDPRVEAIFRELFENFRPDLVHLQHLSTLSVRIPLMAKEMNCPVIMTLHDYWLMCPQGQMLKRDLTVCDKVDLKECESCRIRYLSRDKKILGMAAVLEKILGTFSVVSGFKSIGCLLNGLFKKAVHLRLGVTDPLLAEREDWMRQLTGCVDSFVVPSKTLMKKFETWGIPQNKLVYLPNGYHSGAAFESAKTYSPRLRFGFLGSLAPSKGVHILLEAAKKISPDKAEFHFYGGIPRPFEGHLEYESVIRKFERHKHIHFHGEYRYQDLGKILSEIDVLVMPSIWTENAPLTVQEALLSATPVLAAGDGAMPEMVEDGQTGLIFKRGNVRSLIECCQKLVNDPALYRTLRTFLMRKVEGFRTGTQNKTMEKNGFVFEPMDAHAAVLTELYHKYMRMESVR